MSSKNFAPRRRALTSHVALSVAVLVTLAIIVMGGGASLASGPNTWDRDCFVPLSGPSLSGLSPKGEAYLATHKELDLDFDAPDQITHIEAHAFQNLGLTAVVLPDTLVEVGEYAFASNAIETLSVIDTPSTPSVLERIGANAFRDNKLTALTLPATCTEVGANAFVNNLLASLDAPGLEVIGAKAFANNKLTAITLDALSAIDATAFDGNGRVVAISSTQTIASGLGTTFSGGSGFIVNPVTIKVNYLNVDTGTAFRSPDVLGDDFTSDYLYPAGQLVTINAPAITGWMLVDPPDLYEDVMVTNGQVFNFNYKSASADPIINVTSRRINYDALNTTPISQATVLSWITATSGVDGSPITYITVTLGGSETFPIPVDVIRDVEVTYRVIDVYGNIGSRTITIEISPGALYDEIIPGKGWRYIDFVYYKEV